MACKYGRYPFCKQCFKTGEKCEDSYSPVEENYTDYSKNNKFVKEVLKMLEG